MNKDTADRKSPEHSTPLHPSGSKTYSVTIKTKDGYWITNWHKYFDLSEVNWKEVKAWCKSAGHAAFGYQLGTRSNQQTAARTRTVLSDVPASW